MICTTCGAAGPPGDRFCRSCGAGFSDAAAPPVVRSSAPPIATAPAAPARRRRNVLGTILGGLSLAGLVSSVTLMLVRGPAPDPVVGATGASDPSPVTLPSVAPPTGGGLESSTTSCTSDSLGYEVAYPTNLVTSNEPADQTCRFFDEQAFEAPADGELPPTQIRIYTSDESYRSLDRGLANTDGLRRWDMRVDGHRAFLMEMLDVQIDGAGTGTLYAYVIDLDGAALVADAFQPFSERFGSTKRILDRMVASLRFLPDVFA